MYRAMAPPKLDKRKFRSAKNPLKGSAEGDVFMFDEEVYSVGKRGGDLGKNPFEDKEQLQRALAIGNGPDSLELNNRMIEEAVEALFPNGATTLPPDRYLEIISGNYVGFDLKQHGARFNLHDFALLTKHLFEATNSTRQASTDISNEWLAIGCGQGRDAVPMIELAVRNKIEKLTFNDLLADGVEQTRELIRSIYGDAQVIDGVKLDFLVGDAAELDVNEMSKQDLVIAWWFVTSEIADFSSSDALSLKRSRFYENIRKMLTKYGAFIEDLPYSDVSRLGHYYYMHAKSHYYLKKRGILPEDNHRILVTNFSDVQEGGIPYHIRLLDHNGNHRNRMERLHGFAEASSEITVMPAAIKIEHEEAFNALFETHEGVMGIFEGDRREIEQRLNQMKSTMTEPYDSQDPNRIVKKTYVWRPGL